MSEKIYGPEGFGEAGSRKKEGKLSVEIVKNGIIYPKNVNASWIMYKNQFNTGYVLDENKRWVNVSGDRDQNLGSRGNIEDITIDDIEKKHKKALFLGACNAHWGHFLIEGLSRVWAILETDKYKDYEFCYCLREKNSFPSYMREVFHLLGIDSDKIKIIEQPTQYDEIAIPQISSKINSFWTDEYATTINKIKSNVNPVKGGKYYLTRTAYIDNIIGEPNLEDIFRKNGYQIVSPEQLSVTEQISIFSGADEIASISGTTAHNMVFMKDTATGVILERLSSFPNRTQAVINDMIKAQINVIKANYSFLIYSIGAGPFLMALTPWLQQYFDEQHLVYDHKDVKAYYKYIYGYAKLWAGIYQKKEKFSLMLRENPKVTEKEARQLVSKVAKAVAKAKDKTYFDKTMRDEKVLLEDNCRIDLYSKDAPTKTPFELKRKYNNHDIRELYTIWMQSFNMIGYSIERPEHNIKLELTVNTDCSLEFSLKGSWKLKDEKDRSKGLIEIWVDYNKFSINGKDILTTPIATWHNKPFNYSMKVHKGDVLNIEVEWEKHQTIEEKLFVKTKELVEIQDKQEQTIQNLEEMKQTNEKLVAQVKYLTAMLAEISNQQAFATNQKKVKGNFWYKRVETDAYVKTYICGIRTRKRPANVCKFLDTRLYELEKRLKAYIIQATGKNAGNT